MNKQSKKGIEWTNYTWNPVGGCLHGCMWNMPDGTIAECYAKSVAEKVAATAYPNGFEYHYWNPSRLEEPLKAKKPSRIFLDSMSDLMGHWVSDEQIEQVLDICRQASWHTFQLLTKNAPRLLRFSFPDNVWVGVSAPPSIMFGKTLTQHQQERMVIQQLKTFRETEASTKWMSIEPLSFDIAPLLTSCELNWAVIGAASNGAKTYQPKREWVENLLQVLDAQSIPVFFKGNLEWAEHRAEFPTYQVLYSVKGKVANG